MRYFVPFIGLLFTNAASTQIADNYQPASPIPMPCYELTATNGINTPLHEDSKCIVTHPDASIYPGYEAFVYATTNDVEIKAGEEIHFNGKMHFAANNGNEIWAHIETPDPIEIAWFYPQNSPGIAMRHEKMELGFDLPTEIEQDIAEFFDINVAGANELNPYNRHDIDITVSFFKDGVHIKDVDAFYYREMEINTSTKHWDEVNTDYSWRVRFAPPDYGGNWTAMVNVKATNHADLNSFISFQVINSTNPGYLEIGKYKKHLRTSYDKNSFFGIGQSLTWPVYTDNSDYDFKVDSEEADLFHTDVETFGNSGGNFCRINAWPQAHEFELEALGNYDPRQDMAWDLDRIIEYLEEIDIYLMFVIKHHEPFIKRDPSNPDWQGWEGEKWDENVYRTNRSFSFGNFASETLSGVTEPIDFFSSNDARDLFKNYARYVISRWGYSTSIGAWQIMSEIDLTANYHYDPIQQDIIHDWLSEIGSFIENDLGDTHLFSVAAGGASNETGTVGNNQIDNGDLFDIEYLDFTGVHLYIDDKENSYVPGGPLSPGPIGGDKLRNRNCDTRYKTAYNFLTGNKDVQENGIDPHPLYQDKPFMFDEYGFLLADQHTPYSNDFWQCQDLMFHNDLWASACMGSMSTGFDWFYVDNPNVGVDNYPGLKLFFSGIDFESVNYMDASGSNLPQRWPKENKIHDSNWTQNPGYKNKTKLEAFTTIANDKTQAFGWVHNRSHYYFNFFTANTPGSCLDDLFYIHGVFERPEDDDYISSTLEIKAYDESSWFNNEKAYFELEDMMSKTWYTVDFYNTITGQLEESYSFKSKGSGKLKIWVPNMGPNGNPDLGFKLYESSWKMANIEEDTLKEVEISDSEFNVKSIGVYPNPYINETLYIDLTDEEIESLKIIDPVGKQVYSTQEINSNGIDLGNLTTGVYLIIVTYPDGTVLNDKLIVRSE